MLSFYPRHPRGWRRHGRDGHPGHQRVSIHATLAGGDTWLRSSRARRRSFLSTPPSRVATCFSSAVFSARMLLSTPPSRVATFRTAHSRGCSCYVSIHATLAGGDGPASARHTTTPTRFYPRHPRGWRRPGPVLRMFRLFRFYPRHPRGWRLFRRLDPAHIVTMFLSTPPSRVATRAWPSHRN